MTNSNTAAMLQELQACQDKLRAAKKRLDTKKKTLMGAVMQDTPDLFGQRQAQSETKLFDIRVDMKQVTKALEPIQAEIIALNNQIDTLTYKIIQAEDNPEPTLFDLGSD